MKYLLIILFVLPFSYLFSDKLPVFVDTNRFLDESSNTIFDIIYQIPFSSFSYIKTNSGFAAELKVEYSLTLGEKIVDQGDFINKLIFPNQEMTKSEKLFRNKLDVTLPSSIYTMHITFTDVNSLQKFSWSNELIILQKDAFLSDLEFSSKIVADTTNYLEKFHRNDQLFYVDCTHIYSKGELDSLSVYYELGNIQYPVGKLLEKINIVRDDETLKVIIDSVNCRGSIESQIRKIDISDLTSGYYNIMIEIKDPISQAVNKKEDYFSIKQKDTNNYRLFVEIEDEFTLLKYFLPSVKTKIWKNLTYEGKSKFINRFWESNDTDPSTKKNEFFELIRNRIRYCDEHYSYFKDGWNTDRGRIFIRFGKPDDVLYGNTSLKTKYAQKKYEIWKYRLHNNYTYLFLDTQTNGNYKLIYSDNDPHETSSSNLKTFMGEDFDMNLLD